MVLVMSQRYEIFLKARSWRWVFFSLLTHFFVFFILNWYSIFSSLALYNKRTRDMNRNTNYSRHRQTPIITDVQIQYLSPMFRAAERLSKGVLPMGDTPSAEPLRKEAPYCPVLQGDKFFYLPISE